jgi:two-component system, response regulator
MDRKLILLVEDTPDDEELALRALRQHSVLNQVVVARDGVEALDYLFGRGQYDGRDTTIMPELVLLDLKLPKISGLQVLEQIRAHEQTRNLPVVILTSSIEEEDIVSSYSHGANSYVRKPIQFLEFTEAVRRLSNYWLLLNRTTARRLEEGHEETVTSSDR